jgi:F-type H+-transporting ATPase subunit epsilon
MPATFQLSIVAPDRTIFEGAVSGVIVPAVSGYMGVWAGHEPEIVALRDGLIEFDGDDGRTWVASSGGFMEVNGQRVIVLADDAELSTEISLQQAEIDLDNARKALRGEGEMSREEATKELQRAMARIKAARRK